MPGGVASEGRGAHLGLVPAPSVHTAAAAQPRPVQLVVRGVDWVVKQIPAVVIIIIIIIIGKNMFVETDTREDISCSSS